MTTFNLFIGIIFNLKVHYSCRSNSCAQLHSTWYSYHSIWLLSLSNAVESLELHNISM